jgi:PAS domain-containing protein
MPQRLLPTPSANCLTGGSQLRAAAALRQTDAPQPEFEGLFEAAPDFRALIESAPDAILLVDSLGAIALANRRTEELFGYPAEDLLGRPVEMLVPGRFQRPPL